MNNHRGFSLFEILASMSISFTVGVAAFLSFHSISTGYQKAVNQNREIVAITKVHQYLENVIQDIDSQPFPIAPRVADALAFANGTSIPTKSKLKPNSSIIFSITPEENAIGDVTSTGTTTVNFNCFGYCPKEADYLALGYETMAEVHFSCLDWGKECVLSQLSGAVRHQEFIAKESITKVIPLKKRWAIFPDDQNNLRFLGFDSNSINENQPITRAMPPVLFGQALSSEGIVTVYADFQSIKHTIRLSARHAHSTPYTILLNKL